MSNNQIFVIAEEQIRASKHDITETNKIESSQITSDIDRQVDFFSSAITLSKKISEVLAVEESADLKPATELMGELMQRQADKALKQYSKIENRIAEHQAIRDQILDSANMQSRTLTTTEALIVQLRNQRINKLNDKLTNLTQKSPDAFYAINGKKLLAYTDQLKNGRLVETEYVKEKLEEVMAALRSGSIVLIHGETGSGKTEIAKLAAKRFSLECSGVEKEALLVRGYPWMSSDELFGHQVLKSSGISLSETPDEIKNAISEWEEKHPNASVFEKKEANNQITRKAQQTSNVTVSEYILGMVYEAARDGRLVILDEVNYIPPGLLAKLNEIMTLRPGDFIRIQEDGLPPIEIKEGFGIIETGNLNYNLNMQRYGNRFEIDPAHLNRIKLLDYDYLSQAVEGHFSEVKNSYEKDLFVISIAALIAKEGSIVLPEGDINAIWRLSQYAKVTQMAFSGQIGDKHDFGFQKTGIKIGIVPDVVISPRTLQALLNEWKTDGFKFELDHYLYSHFISSAIKIQDEAYLYQVAQKFGFFKTEGWEQNVPYDSIERYNSLPVKNQKNPSAAIELIPEYKVIEAIYGQPPERTIWPNVEFSAEKKREINIAKAIKTRAILDMIDAEIKQLEG